MDKDSINEQLSRMTVDPSVQNSVDFDTTSTPSVASIITYEENSPSSALIQTSATVPSIRSDTEHHYQLVGNISVINQLEVNQDVLCICYTETYDLLAAGLSDGNLKFYKVSSEENILTLCDAEMMQNPAPVTAIKHRPVHKSHPITHTLIATYANGCVKCWHYPTAQCIYTIREKRQTLGLAYHPQLPKFVTVGDDTNLYLYDEETKTRERVFHGSNSPDIMDGHKSRVFSACFHPKSAHEIISAGWDDTIQFWDTRQAHSLRFISGVHMCGDGLDISRNGKEILTCSWQKKDPLQLWDYGSGKLIVSLEPDSYPCLLYAGKYVTNLYVACGGCDTDLFRIVDLRSHSTMAMIKYLKGGVYSLDIGPLEAKYSKRTALPKLAFCAGTTIFEVDAQPTQLTAL
ncbi:putative WD repeat-containing protein [Formica fusca]